MDSLKRRVLFRTVFHFLIDPLIGQFPSHSNQFILSAVGYSLAQLLLSIRWMDPIQLELSSVSTLDLQRERKKNGGEEEKNLLVNYANGRPIKLNEFHFSNAWTCFDTTPSTMRAKKKNNTQTKIVNCRPKRRKIELWTLGHVDVFSCVSHSSAAIKRYSIFIGELC